MAATEMEVVTLSELMHTVLERTEKKLQSAMKRLPRKKDNDRRLILLRWLAETREQLIRLLVLLRWAEKPCTVEGDCSEAMVQRQHEILKQAASHLRFVQERLQAARVIRYDVATAADVLASGTFKLLPDSMRRNFVESAPSSADERRRALLAVDERLRARLVHMPRFDDATSLLMRGTARASLRVDNEFDVLLTLQTHVDAEPWAVCGVRVFVRDATAAPLAANDDGDGDDEDDDDDDESASPCLHLAQLERLRAFLHFKVNAMAAEVAAHEYHALALTKIYEIMRSMCVSLAIDRLRHQAKVLQARSWRGAIDVLERNQVRAFEVAYWCGRDSALVEQSSSELATAAAASSSSSSSSAASATSSLLSSGAPPPRLVVKVLQETQRVGVHHRPPIVDASTGRVAVFAVDMRALDVEKLLLRAIELHARSALVVLRRSVVTSDSTSTTTAQLLSSRAAQRPVAVCRHQLVVDSCFAVSVSVRAGHFVVGAHPPSGADAHFFDSMSALLNDAGAGIVEVTRRVHRHLALRRVELRALAFNMQPMRAMNAAARIHRLPLSLDDETKAALAQGSAMFLQFLDAPSFYIVATATAARHVRFALLLPDGVGGDEGRRRVDLEHALLDDAIGECRAKLLPLVLLARQWRARFRSSSGIRVDYASGHLAMTELIDSAVRSIEVDVLPDVCGWRVHVFMNKMEALRFDLCTRNEHMSMPLMQRTIEFDRATSCWTFTYSKSVNNDSVAMFVTDHQRMTRNVMLALEWQALLDARSELTRSYRLHTLTPHSITFALAHPLDERSDDQDDDDHKDHRASPRHASMLLTAYWRDRSYLLSLEPVQHPMVRFIEATLNVDYKLAPLLRTVRDTAFAATQIERFFSPSAGDESAQRTPLSDYTVIARSDRWLRVWFRNSIAIDFRLLDRFSVRIDDGSVPLYRSRAPGERKLWSHMMPSAPHAPNTLADGPAAQPLPDFARFHGDVVLPLCTQKSAFARTASLATSGAATCTYVDVLLETLRALDAMLRSSLLSQRAVLALRLAQKQLMAPALQAAPSPPASSSSAPSSSSSSSGSPSLPLVHPLGCAAPCYMLCLERFSSMVVRAAPSADAALDALCVAGVDGSSRDDGLAELSELLARITALPSADAALISFMRLLLLPPAILSQFLAIVQRHRAGDSVELLLTMPPAAKDQRAPRAGLPAVTVRNAIAGPLQQSLITVYFVVSASRASQPHLGAQTHFLCYDQRSHKVYAFAWDDKGEPERDAMPLVTPAGNDDPNLMRLVIEELTT
jgi:Mediator complex subunit MED14